MASLDLGTLVARIKVEGAETAKSVLKSISSELGKTEQSSKKTSTGVESFASAVSSGIGNTSLFGTNLGTLATAFGGSEVAAVAMGTALGGMVTAGFTALVAVAKQAITSMIDFAKSAAEVGVSYQKQMSVVQAISGATSGDLKVLGETARQMGKDTIFSAKEVAQAMEYTSLAGYNTQETIAALPGVLNLAAASNMDLARASDIVTDYVTAFGLSVEDSSHLVDVMAYAMSNANTNTEQLGEAYKASAATCNSFGVSAEEATSWLSMMANAGYKGEQAGTALNAVLARMYGETKTTNDALMEYGLTMYDTEGNAKNFTQVMGEIQAAMQGMTEQQQNIFMKAVAGTNQLSKFATMIQVSASEVDNFTKELENSTGTAEKMTQTMTNNIDGLQKSIASKTDDIKLSLFDAFSPLGTDILLLVDTFVNGLATCFKPIGAIIGGILNVFTPIFEGIKQIGEIIFNLAADIFEPFTDLFITRFETSGEVVGFFVDIIVAGFDLAAKALKPFVAITSVVIEAIIQIYQVTKSYISDKLSGFLDEINAFVDGFKEGFLLLPNIVLVIVNKIIDLLNKIPGVAIDNVDYLTDAFQDGVDKLTEKTEEYNDAIKEMKSETTSNFKGISKDLDDLNDDVDKKVSKITSTMKKVASATTHVTWSSTGKPNQNFSGTYLGAYAEGTDYVPKSGRYLVGERGPEIVTIPKGASVTPNHELGGSTTNQFNISIDASSVQEFNDLINICNNARITERTS